MSAVTASLCSTLMFVVFVHADEKIITAEPGQDVTLPCRVPYSNITILILEWSRADLEDKYVFMYQDGYFVPEIQHPSFNNRVDLQDGQMKDGDVSVILKNVTINDAGTYECRALVLESLSREFTIVSLSVLILGQPGGQEKDEDNKDGGEEDRGKEDGSVGLIVALSVSALLLVAAIFVFLIYKNQSRGSNKHPADQSAQPLQIYKHLL